MMSPYKLGIVGTCGIPASYGGFETLVENLVMYLARDSAEIRVIAQRGYKPINRDGFQQIVFPFKANGKTSVLYDIISMFYFAKDSDCILVLGVSGAIALPLIRMINRNLVIITHIDGLEWSRPKWGRVAKFFLRLSERIAIHWSDTFVADNKGILLYVANHYGRHYLRRAALVTYGGNTQMESQKILEPLRLKCHNTSSLFSPGNERYFLVVGRAEKENNLAMIIEAYEEAKLWSKGYFLLLLTNAEATVHGRYLLSQYGMTPGVIFAESEYDRRKVRYIRDHASAYIHGHSAGGTNPSLVEAIHATKPIIAYDVNYNRYTTDNLALYFSEKNSLLRLMHFIVDSDVEIISDFAILARAEYAWSSIAARYDALIRNSLTRKLEAKSIIGARIKLGVKYRIFRLLVSLTNAARRKYNDDLSTCGGNSHKL